MPHTLDDPAPLGRPYGKMRILGPVWNAPTFVVALSLFAIVAGVAALLVHLGYADDLLRPDPGSPEMSLTTSERDAYEVQRQDRLRRSEDPETVNGAY